jgi:hypothetical protein
MRVFVSYHTPDRDAAQRLADGLNARRPDLEFFVAPRVIAAGAYWVPRLGEALEGSDALIFLAGKRVGAWQEIEFQEAFRLAQQPERAGRPLIVPIVMGGRAPGLKFFDLFQQIFADDPAAPDTLEAVLKALEGARAEKAPAWSCFNPYKGLPAFTSSDAAFFFGREALTSDTLNLLISEPRRALVLVGNSGVGKSSLAQAGVVAALRSQIWPTGGDWPMALADSRRWLPLTVRPEDQPLKHLALAFTRLMFDDTFQQDREANGWVGNFSDGGKLDGLLRAAKESLAERLGSEAPARFLLYIDQGEELYASALRDGKPDADAERQARTFSRLLTEGVVRTDVQVLLSLRSDYYGHLQADQALFDAARVVNVPPMGAEALRQVIERPAAKLGVRFHPSEMPAFLSGATVRESGALPFLADLLSDLWKDMQARGDGVLRLGRTSRSIRRERRAARARRALLGAKQVP